jgi:hypothetical protein
LKRKITPPPAPQRTVILQCLAQVYPEALTLDQLVDACESRGYRLSPHIGICKLLHKIVCALVDRPEFVVIKTHVTEDGVSFAIDVHPDDTGKIIGRQGRNAKSLRTIVGAVGQKLHRRYIIVVDEGNLG